MMLKKYIESLGFVAGFVDNTVVCLFPYFTGYATGANLSVYCYAPDYHEIVASYLDKIGKFVGGNYTIFCDIGRQNDIELAYAAGLGFVGRNKLLINPKYGSYCFIGGVVTERHLGNEQLSTERCANCGRCEKACPGDALAKGDAKLCASYISQKKGELTTSEIEILKKSGLVFGCDICQKVCPHNNGVKTEIREFRENLVFRYDPKIQYSNRAFLWRGTGILDRNFKILQE